MQTQDVELGFLATPDRGPCPGVVLIHDVWGLTDHARDLTRRLSGEGFAVLALERGRHGARALLPLVPALVAVAPLLVYFETFPIAAAFSRELSLGPGELLENFAIVGAHLLRHEFLLPALGCRAALLGCDAVARRRGAAAIRDPARDASRFLWLLAAGYALIGCVNPLPMERYFVVLSPILTLAFLLDASSLVAAVSQRAAPARRRWAARATVAGVIALAVAARFSAARFSTTGSAYIEVQGWSSTWMVSVSPKPLNRVCMATP